MNARLFLAWLWREILSVVLVGAVGMVSFELAWLAVRLPGQPPRSFLLFAGVALCSWLHPRLTRPKRRLAAAH
ncbi:MAG: hypothetical protein JST54_26270 [Deltaproteobacteria bacterium]|nr:hypothetical protein [Deltaproteobacteria bacterium]